MKEGSPYSGLVVPVKQGGIYKSITGILVCRLKIGGRGKHRMRDGGKKDSATVLNSLFIVSPIFQTAFRIDRRVGAFHGRHSATK